MFFRPAGASSTHDEALGKMAPDDCGSAEIGPVEIFRIQRAESQQTADLDNALNIRQNAAVGNPLSLTVR